MRCDDIQTASRLMPWQPQHSNASQTNNKRTEQELEWLALRTRCMRVVVRAITMVTAELQWLRRAPATAGRGYGRIATTQRRSTAQRSLCNSSRSIAHTRNSSSNSQSNAARQQPPQLRNWLPDRADVAFEFKCTQCGKCCTGKGGRVRVNEREIEAIAAALPNASVADVKRSFLRRVPAPAPIASDASGTASDEQQLQEQWVLRQTPDDSQCIFLDGAKCSIYRGASMASGSPCTTRATRTR